jgi:phage gp37-like protein
MIAELQTALVALLEAYNNDNDYAKQIKPYGGELRNPKNVNYTPSVYVDVAVSGNVESEDVLGELFDATLSPEIILFDENKASGKAKHTDLAKGIDWVLNALRGATLTISGVPVIVGLNIQWRVISDFYKPVAIIRPTLTINEDAA